MEWGVKTLSDLQRMKEEMDRAWDSLIKKSAFLQEWEISKWIEGLPKFEGTGRRNLKSRSNKTIKFLKEG
jgi:hypothetical protein